jgi:hypothetical protein
VVNLSQSIHPRRSEYVCQSANNPMAMEGQRGGVRRRKRATTADTHSRPASCLGDFHGSLAIFRYRLYSDLPRSNSTSGGRRIVFVDRSRCITPGLPTRPDNGRRHRYSGGPASAACFADVRRISLSRDAPVRRSSRAVSAPEPTGMQSGPGRTQGRPDPETVVLTDTTISEEFESPTEVLRLERPLRSALHAHGASAAWDVPTSRRGRVSGRPAGRSGSFRGRDTRDSHQR